MKEYLLTAGPTPVPERVLLAMARPMLYHRAPAFTECLREVQEGLKWLMQTKQQPLVLTGSGTIAMDAAVCNFLSAGDKAVVIRGGKFGERWGKICEAYGVKCVYVDVEWGKSVDAKAVAKAFTEAGFEYIQDQNAEFKDGYFRVPRVASRANLWSPSRSAVGGYPVSVKTEPIEET